VDFTADWVSHPAIQKTKSEMHRKKEICWIDSRDSDLVAYKRQLPW